MNNRPAGFRPARPADRQTFGKPHVIALIIAFAGVAGCAPRQGGETAEAMSDGGDRPTAPVSDSAEAAESAATTASVGSGTSGEELFNARCASCHLDPDAARALPLEALAKLNPAHIVFAMTNGSMRIHAEGLPFMDMIGVATFIAGERDPYEPAAANFCSDRTIDLTPVIGRWGIDARATAALPSDASGIDSGNVSDLRLAWAFGLPDVADARSQPVVTGNTLFVAATSGHLFALDRRSGCIRWHRALPAPPRTALTMATVDGEAALVFGDTEVNVNAVDPRTGEPIWRTNVAVSEHSLLTGATIQHEDRLIVPISLYEVALAADPTYECCRSHGAVMALDADTGEPIWTTHMAEPAEPQGVTSVGTRTWGPSGVPVWSTPTVDAARGLVYVGTGQNASRPATEYSDAVVALDLETGNVAWHRQTIAGDAYNQACDAQPAGPNCPMPRGPDHDIGAAVVLTRDAAGNDRLIVGQKSGDVFALDPDDEGSIVWRRQVGAGSALGGIHWGLAVSDGVVFAPIADPPFPIPNYQPAPGLYAIAAEDGELLWESPAERGCETDMFAYFGREAFYPDCPFYFGLSSAPLVVNDLVFAPALDGKVRAYSTRDGTVLWETETARAFQTVNGVDAHGGSIDVAGVQVAGDMLYVQSGYAQFGQLPGNVLLGFELPETVP